MSWIPAAVGGVLGTVGTIGANLSGDKLRKKLNQAKNTNPAYAPSTDVNKRMALANNFLNGRSLASLITERQLATAQNNQLNFINRNATDGSQALALGTATLGQTQGAIQDNAVREAQDYYNKLNNYNLANEAVVNEYTKAFDDKVRRWQDMVNIDVTRHAIRQQQGQNMANLGGMIAGMSFGGGGGGASAGAAKGGK